MEYFSYATGGAAMALGLKGAISARGFYNLYNTSGAVGDLVGILDAASSGDIGEIILAIAMAGGSMTTSNLVERGVLDESFVDNPRVVAFLDLVFDSIWETGEAAGKELNDRFEEDDIPGHCPASEERC
jgi:hypothetical protein